MAKCMVLITTPLPSKSFHSQLSLSSKVSIVLTKTSISLRRVHFDPRPRGRKAKNSTERRGGKAGGNNPPMDILKANWIREVDVANTTAQSQEDGDEESDYSYKERNHGV